MALDVVIHNAFNSAASQGKIIGYIQLLISRKNRFYVPYSEFKYKLHVSSLFSEILKSAINP